MNSLAFISYVLILFGLYFIFTARSSAKTARRFFEIAESEKIRGEFATIRYEVFELLVAGKISAEEYELIYDLCSNVMRKPSTHKEYGNSFASYIIERLSVWRPPSTEQFTYSPAAHGLWKRLAELLDELALQNSRTLRFLLWLERLIDPQSDLRRMIERTQNHLKSKELAKNKDHKAAKRQLFKFESASGC